MNRTRVLFVDDDPNLLDSLRRSLHRHRREWAMTFHPVSEDALAEAQALDVAVVVTDWMMPGLDGMEFCRRLRALEDADQSARRYIVVLTGRQETEATVEALEHGADDFMRKPFDLRELEARVQVGARLLKMQVELRIANERLQELATTDPLTGLLNRRRGIEILETELVRVSRGLQNLVVLLLDLDHFKQVNDSQGHDAGDVVLQTLAERLRGACRPYDSVVRWGGEEFLVLCPQVSECAAMGLGDRLRAVVSQSMIRLRNGGALEVTASAGLAVALAGSNWEFRELVARADEALYWAKEDGRNCLRQLSAAEGETSGVPQVP